MVRASADGHLDKDDAPRPASPGRDRLGVRACTIAPASAAPPPPPATAAGTTASALRRAVLRHRRTGLGRRLRRDLGRHLAGDAELVRLPALLGDHGDHLLEPLLERIEIVALLALQHLG